MNKVASAVISISFLWVFSPLGRAQTLGIDRYFTDLEDEPNPSWFTLRQSLSIGQNSFGPARGSTIEVNQEEVRVGRYSNREISRPLALHSITSSYIGPRGWGNQTRWYQEVGNTQVFRLFPGEDNTRNSRVNAPRSEVFGLESWMRGDGWHEWSGRYTFLKVRHGAVLQIKHNSTYWSMQLILDENPDGSFDLSYVKLRDRHAKTLLLDDVVGKGVDIKVVDDGENHKVYVDGVLKVENSMTDRPLEDDNRARWGLYTPTSAMDRDILILVTGAYVGPARIQGEDSTKWGEMNVELDIPEDLIVTDYDGWLSSHPDVDAEPNPAFLEDYYSNRDNSGYGYI